MNRGSLRTRWIQTPAEALTFFGHHLPHAIPPLSVLHAISHADESVVQLQQGSELEGVQFVPQSQLPEGLFLVDVVDGLGEGCEGAAHREGKEEGGVPAEPTSRMGAPPPVAVPTLHSMLHDEYLQGGMATMNRAQEATSRPHQQLLSCLAAGQGARWTPGRGEP